MRTSQLQLLRDYVDGRKECMDYVLEIAGNLDFVRKNEDLARGIASELDKWICQEGHVLRYHTERLSLVLASKDELHGSKHVKQVRDKVLNSLSKSVVAF